MGEGRRDRSSRGRREENKQSLREKSEKCKRIGEKCDRIEPSQRGKKGGEKRCTKEMTPVPL